MASARPRDVTPEDWKKRVKEHGEFVRFAKIREGLNVPPNPNRFTVNPREHALFKEWYDDLDPVYRGLLEQKGMLTEEALEKIWVSGLRAGFDNAPREPMRVGPP